MYLYGIVKRTVTDFCTVQNQKVRQRKNYNTRPIENEIVCIRRVTHSHHTATQQTAFLDFSLFACLLTADCQKMDDRSSLSVQNIHGRVFLVTITDCT
jgi:hypothetical protein